MRVLRMVMGVMFIGLFCRAEDAGKTHGAYDEKTAPARNVQAGLNLSPDRISRYYINDAEKSVGIFYVTWFDQFLGRGWATYNLEKILKYPEGERPWGPVGSWHFWGEPEIGLYRSSDPFVIERHLRQLQAAGIDFIILDNTNMSDSWDDEMDNRIAWRPYGVFLETMLSMIHRGEKVPRVVVWTSPVAAMEVYNRFYNMPEYRNLFVRWREEGKDQPFMLLTSVPYQDEYDAPYRKEIAKFCTVRDLWGLKKQNPNVGVRPDEWEYLSRPPQHLAVRNGKKEHMSVTTAMQGNYINLDQPGRWGRRGGKTFQDQWRLVFKEQPPIVTVAWWNEWGVQRRYDKDLGSLFIDNYDREYSRDIEPMKGGHGDAYYRMLCGYVKAYKAGDAIPENLLEKDLLMEKNGVVGGTTDVK